MGFKLTRRSCTAEGCLGRLKDSILDWESPLPDEELDRCEEHLDEADLVLCLGTSLVIEPAAFLPLRVKPSARFKRSRSPSPKPQRESRKAEKMHRIKCLVRLVCCRIVVHCFWAASRWCALLLYAKESLSLKLLMWSCEALCCVVWCSAVL